MQMLTRLRLAGWKSIKQQTIELQPLNVFIGGNGAGKSNLISFFKLLNAMVAQTPRLREFVGKAGGADALLHFGSRQTPFAEVEVAFRTHSAENTYYARWTTAAGDSLIFSDEQVGFVRDGSPDPYPVSLGAGHSESKLIEVAESGDTTAEVVLRLLRTCRLFHFHDTSDASPIRQSCYIEANRFLHPDGGNVAAMLYLYQHRYPAAYRRIVSSVRQVVPHFDDFLLEPQRLNPRNILLKWKQRGSDYEFGPHQFSDGSLRFIALATLLSQPSDSFPLLIALDEPELGLHPAAIELLAGMARAASLNCQLILATQSPVLLDYFDPEHVVVVDNRDGQSQFRRLAAGELDDWLKDYTLSELWEKNVVGGGPY